MPGPLPRNLLPDNAAVDADGRLSIGGVDVLDLVAEHGTPVFVYDEAHVRARCREAVEAWGDGVAYATKAFLCRAMAKLAFEEGMALDVASEGELHVALAADVPAERLVLHGNNKSDDRAPPRARAGVGRIVVDSNEEIDRITRLAPQAGVRPEGSPADHAGRRGAHPRVRPDRTGRQQVRIHGLHRCRGRGRRTPADLDRQGIVELVGVHAHIGSNVFLLSSYEKAAAVLAGIVAPLGLPELVVGGGLGVPYVEGEEAPSIAEWAETTRNALVSAGLPPTTRVTAEPGRSIVAGRGSHAVHGRHDQATSRHPQLRRRRRRHERQPETGAVRQRLRGVPPTGDERRPIHARPARRQALRIR